MENIVGNLEKQIQELIQSGEYLQANKLLIEIKKLTRSSDNNIKGSINKVSKGVTLAFDKGIESIDIENKIRNYLEKLSTKFNAYIIDEVAILRLRNGLSEPVYFYSVNPNRTANDFENALQKSKLINELNEDMEFFLENIINEGKLDDGEGTLAGNGVEKAFDAILRVGDYIIAFNNYDESIETMKQEYDLDPNDLIKEISKFFYELD